MADSISAIQQFKAVAYLRWRLFANGFRRKGGAGEVAARIIVFPIAAIFVIGPVIGASVGSYAAVSRGHAEFLTGIFWAIFALQIIASINLSPPGLSFDPESLIRFPLSFPRYLAIRLVLGLLAASTLIGSCALLAAATGASLARHSLLAYAFAAALALALCNMLLVRMIFAWVDRWLSTRRAREIFTALIFLFSFGFQYLNVTFNNVGHRPNRAAQAAKISAVVHLYHRFEPVLHRLPPSLAADVMLAGVGHHAGAALLSLLGLLIFAALFLAVFAWRMQREYRGENLSEAANSPVVETTGKTSRQRLPAVPAAAAAFSQQTPAGNFVPDVVSACLRKEWTYVLRNPAQFYGLLGPLVMVVLFAGRVGNFARTGFVFPAAVAYSVLGISALAYNVFGLDASGIQFYFLAPISFRSVMLAKNLFGFFITALQLVLVYVVLLFVSGPPPVLMVLATICWVVFASLVNATVGNLRSITTPKKQDPGRISRKQASQMSALLCIGLLLAIGGLGAALLAVSSYLSLPWLPVPILLALACGAFALYVTGLNRVDALALDHRESMIEELSKTS